MILAVTGHRLKKIGGYRVPNQMSVEVDALVRQYLQQHAPEYVITGMAIGFDQWVANICRQMGIPYKAYLPLAGQDAPWPPQARQFYNELLHDADEVFICHNGPYTPEVMQNRNRRMVDAADRILALWNGTSGGTANCITYALARQKPVDRLPIRPELWEFCRQQELGLDASRRSRFQRGGTPVAQETIYRRRGAVQNPPRSTIVDELFAEQRRAQVEEVTRAFGVPAELLGIDTASGPDETHVALPENMDDATARAMLRALQDRLGHAPKPKKTTDTNYDRFAPKRKIDLDD